MLPPDRLPERLELAHVVFMDIISYSGLGMEQQRRYLAELQQIVRAVPPVVAAASGDLIALPTGDGMALVFFGDPTVAVEAALAIARSLKAAPHLKLRIGLHTGPVYRVADINENLNASGGGINIAQRIMDAGDAGHILLSGVMAEVLLQLEQWKSFVKPLGSHAVKHGVVLPFFSLVTPDAGNSSLPAKLAGRGTARRRMLIAALLASVAVLAMVLWWIGRSPFGQTGRRLVYSITAQRYKDGKPFREPFQLAGEMLFEEDYRIAVNVNSDQPGYLYVLNEGPMPGGKNSVAILYPGAGEAAELPAGKTVRIPREESIRFDNAAGVEKMYLVWSKQPEPFFEALKDDRTAVIQGQVVVLAPDKIGRIAARLAGLLVSPSGVRRDDERRRTEVVSPQAAFAHLIRLEHH